MRLPSSSSLFLAGLAVSSSSSSLSAMAAPVGEAPSSMDTSTTATLTTSVSSSMFESSTAPTATGTTTSIQMKEAFPTAAPTSTVTSTETVTMTATSTRGDSFPAETQSAAAYTPQAAGDYVPVVGARSPEYLQHLQARGLIDLATPLKGVPILGDLLFTLCDGLGLGPGASAESVVTDPAQLEAMVNAATGPMRDAIMAAVGKAAQGATGIVGGAAGGLPVPVPLPVSPPGGPSPPQAPFPGVAPGGGPNGGLGIAPSGLPVNPPINPLPVVGGATSLLPVQPTSIIGRRQARHAPPAWQRREAPPPLVSPWSPGPNSADPPSTTPYNSPAMSH